MLYNVTLSETELQVVSLALGRMVEPKPIAPRKSHKVKETSHPRVMSFYGTTDAELEAWLDEHHDPHWKPKPYRVPALGKPPRLGDKARQREAYRWGEQAARLWKDRGVKVEVPVE